MLALLKQKIRGCGGRCKIGIAILFLTLVGLFLYLFTFLQKNRIQKSPIYGLLTTRTASICTQLKYKTCYNINLTNKVFTIKYYLYKNRKSGPEFLKDYDLSKLLKDYIVQDFLVAKISKQNGGLEPGVYLFVLAWRSYDYGYNWQWLPKLRGKKYSQHIIIFKLDTIYPYSIWISSTLPNVIRKWNLEAKGEQLILRVEVCSYRDIYCRPKKDKYVWNGWSFVEE